MSQYSDWNVYWPRHMLPHGESHWVCTACLIKGRKKMLY